MKQTDARITELIARLTALERERADVVAEINTLRSMRSEETEPIKVVPPGHAGDPTDRNAPIEKKLALFRRLFRGRSDVYPIGWENRTTGRRTSREPPTLAQYAGRLHRLNDVKREVIIYDYADMRVPVLARMAAKRRVGYQAIGYKVLGTRDLFSDRAVTPNEPT
jgi:hypothetical protein